MRPTPIMLPILDCTNSGMLGELCTRIEFES
jgi:hypothetical protein